MYAKLFLPASILAGIIIGAGMFSLPFVFNQIGIVTGTVYVGVAALLFIGIYIFYADIILRTPGNHRFVGYAKQYLGVGGSWVALLMGLVQSLLVLTVYLILAPSFLRLFGFDHSLLPVLIFWCVSSLAILFSTKKIAILEFLIVCGMMLIIFLVFLLGFPQFLTTYFSWGSLDVSNLGGIGAILFALSGTLAIPEIVSYFREAKVKQTYLKHVLILGGLLPALAYLGFVYGVFGLAHQISEDAVSGLVVSPWVLASIGVLGLLSLVSSYIVIGLNARRVLQYDLGISSLYSKTAVVILPLVIYMAQSRGFAELVSLIGSIFLPLENVFVLLMWFVMNQRHRVVRPFAGNIVRASYPLLLLVFLVVLLKGLF